MQGGGRRESLPRISACPFLRWPDATGLPPSAPLSLEPGNRCLALPDDFEPDLDRQGRLCLIAAHLACERFRPGLVLARRTGRPAGLRIVAQAVARRAEFATAVSVPGDRAATVDADHAARARQLPPCALRRARPPADDRSAPADPATERAMQLAAFVASPDPNGHDLVASSCSSGPGDGLDIPAGTRLGAVAEPAPTTR